MVQVVTTIQDGQGNGRPINAKGEPSCFHLHVGCLDQHLRLNTRRTKMVYMEHGTHTRLDETDESSLEFLETKGWPSKKLDPEEEEEDAEEDDDCDDKNSG